MSNHSPSLQEFICPIPICQSEADLGKMLNIFQHLNCQVLAIPDYLGSWGIVNAKDLLSLMADAWLDDQRVSSSHPNHTVSQQSMTCRLIPDVRTLIRSPTLYQADLRLNEFLNYLQDSSLTGDEEVCLVVNRQGELQGRLDRHKIIEYLALNSLSKTKLKLPSSLSYLASLVDALSLPSKIETAQGQTIHANQRWQILEQGNLPASSKTSNSPDRGANLDQMVEQWIESQKSLSQAVQPDDWQHKSRLRDFDLNWELQPEVDLIDLSQKSASEVEIKQKSDWNYLKIPLVHPDQQASELESYYLILATPLIQTSPSAIDSSESTIKKSTTEILGAVSHELKSPLTGIVGLSSLLKGQKLGSLNQRQLRYVELIYHSGQKMMSIVEDLLQLTTLIEEQSSETELINLEFICRQLTQEIVTKVEPAASTTDSIIDFTQPKLSIELGSEMAIANKPLLSSVLSHLMLETVNSSQNFEPLEIQISSRLGMTVITIISQGIASVSNKGFNLTIAEHLATGLGATVANYSTLGRYQLTLLLPKNKIQSSLTVATIDSAPSSKVATATTNLTILCLYPELEVIDPLVSQNHESNFDFQSCSNNSGLPQGYQHRVIEADSIEQAHNLARIWRLDAIILNGYQIAQPSLYLRSLQEYEHLASLPLITLDTRTTEAANQIKGLNVFPCLIPSQCRSIEDLIQVVQIAIES